MDSQRRSGGFSEVAGEKDFSAEVLSLSKKKNGRVFYFSIALILVLAGALSFQYFKLKKGSNAPVAIMPGKSTDEDLAGIVKGEAIVNENTGNDTEAAFSSENFKIKQISIGGDVAMALGDEENNALEVQDVHGETFMNKQQDSVKLVVTWTTNKLAVSQVEYSKNNGQNPKTVQEEDYGFEHGAVIPGLEMGTVYNYKIKARDRWGNEITTGTFAVYGGSKNVSVFELISQQLDQIFGWAIKKN